MTTTTTPPDAAEQAAHAVPRQPLLHDEVVVLAAPTQAWSDRHGDVGTNPVHGYWTGDQRVVSAVTLAVAGSSVEPVATVPAGAREVVFTGLLRGLDGPERTRTCGSTGSGRSASTASTNACASRTGSPPGNPRPSTPDTPDGP